MKILKLLLISFTVLIVLLLAGVFIFVRTFNVNKYLPQITQQAGKAINRKVNIDHANLTINLKGLSLELKGITISDDPQFGPNNFLSLGTADVGLDVAALLKRQVDITKINLDQLKVSIIRSANGTINAQTMVPAASQPATGPTAVNTSSKPQANSAMALPALFVKSVAISHVQLSFEDQNPQSPLHLTVWVDDIKMNASRAGLQGLSVSLQMHAGSGEIKAQADVHGDMTSPSYNFHLQSKGVKVEEVLDQSKSPYKLAGEANAEFTGTGESFEPQAMLENLKGEGQLSLDNARVEKLNILKIILDKLNFIPGLGGIVQNALDMRLPDNVKTEINTDTTVLDKAQTHFKVENKTVYLDSAQLASKLFSIDANGTIDFNLNTNIEVKTYIASGLAMPLTNAAKPLQGLLDAQNRLYIPGNVSGKLPSVSYRPQMDYITKKTVVHEGARQLQKAFNKNPDVGNVVNGLLNNIFK